MKKTLTATVAAGALVASMFSTGASAAPNQLRSRMNGAKEVGTKGDPNGSGTAEMRVNVKRRRICYELKWRRIADPFAAHIHKGKANENGDIVVVLFAETVADNERTACATQAADGSRVTKQQLRRIKRNPQNFYVNVHNDPFPAGAIRGQLRRVRN